MKTIRKVYVCRSNMFGGSKLIAWFEGIYPFWCCIGAPPTSARMRPRQTMALLRPWVKKMFRKGFGQGAVALGDACEVSWAKPPEHSFEEPVGARWPR